jgi:glycosyltransferase involved in cell wall biosynthesis
MQEQLPPYFADRRWPSATGIGIVQAELESRCPAGIEIVDLHVKGKIGSPFSPLRIAMALRRLGKGHASTYISAGFVPPLFHAGPSLIIVHDLTHLHYYGKVRRLYYNLLFKRLYRRCSAIVCVSDFTRQELLGLAKIDPNKVKTIYNGCSEKFDKNTDLFDPGYKYILYPGNYRSYKNLDKLIGAYAESSIHKMGIHLVMTGEGNQHLRELCTAEGVAGYVHFIGRVTDDDMPKLYKGATALVFVSLYEGFGLPIVEAMASGTPVITSNISAMPEIAGDAALLVDPHSQSAIAQAIKSVSSDQTLRSRLIASGHARAQQFSWNKMAQEFWTLANRISLR